MIDFRLVETEHVMSSDDGSFRARTLDFRTLLYISVVNARLASCKRRARVADAEMFTV